jgi:iron complex transport system ATP-binding protein
MEERDGAAEPDGGTGASVERSDAPPAGDCAQDVEDGGIDAGPEGEGSASTFRGEDLVLRYPATDEPVIEEESLRVPPGQVTALVGPNGSGKSTLLKGLADQLAPDDGRVLVDGEDAHALDAKGLARRLGLLSQENAAPESISVEMLVEHGRYPYRGFFDGLTEEDRAEIDRAIRLAGVEHLRDREIGSLSGGQKQLVWIAMVLAQDTDVLLLDEPTTFLDLHHQLEVMEIVETLRDDSDVTVVLVLHDVDQAARYADHMVALQDGAIEARGPPEEVLTEDLLAEVFRIDAAVEETPHGPRTVPLRPRHQGGDEAHGGR